LPYIGIQVEEKNGEEKAACMLNTSAVNTNYSALQTNVKR